MFTVNIKYFYKTNFSWGKKTGGDKEVELIADFHARESLLVCS